MVRHKKLKEMSGLDRITENHMRNQERSAREAAPDHWNRSSTSNAESLCEQRDDAAVEGGAVGCGCVT